jgi:hypothetical protein
MLVQSIAHTEDEIALIGHSIGDLKYKSMRHSAMLPINLDFYYGKLRCLFGELHMCYDQRHVICVEYCKAQSTAMQSLMSHQPAGPEAPQPPSDEA